MPRRIPIDFIYFCLLSRFILLQINNARVKAKFQFPVSRIVSLTSAGKFIDFARLGERKFPISINLNIVWVCLVFGHEMWAIGL